MVDDIFTFLLSKESLPRIWAWVFLLLEVSINAIPYWTGRDRADGDRRYRVTVEHTERPQARRRESLKVDLNTLMSYARMRNATLIDVERLSTSILDYVAIGSDLLAASFVFDITSVVVFVTSPNVDRAMISRPLAAFSIHLIILLLIVFVQSGERTRWKVALHNAAGVLAIFIAFIVLGSLIE
jgi:hypothetical protein